MIDYISGALFMYIFAMPLLLYITEIAENGSGWGRILFAVLWPLASLEALIKMIRGNEE